MSHTINPIPSVTLSSNAPGTSVDVPIFITATQPVSTVTGSIAVEFNGETVTTPLTVTFNEVVTPSASVAIDDPRIQVVVGEATFLSGNGWRIYVTITVV